MQKICSSRMGRPSQIHWLRVSGGTVHYGDRDIQLQVRTLWWSQTPVTRVNLGLTQSQLPLVGVTYYEAEDIAFQLGGRMPSAREWEWMATGSENRRYPWGKSGYEKGKANLLDTGIGKLTPVGSFPNGATPEGLLDVAGNVWEWTSTPTSNAGRYIRGGSYNSKLIYAESKFRNAAPEELGSRGIGFRIVRESAPKIDTIEALRHEK